MHYYLKSKGIKNNAFFLQLLDRDLANVDPYDPHLNQYMCQKIFRECQANFWYFIREVVRIPVQGARGAGAMYELHRGNLALNWCSMLNLNIFLELPRQNYKTVSTLVRYLYIYNFGTTNSKIAFLHKKHEEAKMNLTTLKTLRDNLPSYLQLKQTYSTDGKKLKASNTIEKIIHPLNGNEIKTIPSARSAAAGAMLLRGYTVPLMYIDEIAFIKYIKEIYLNAVPAWKTASMNARANGVPYGIICTTTPGFLTEDEGIFAYDMKEQATQFNESMYDMSYEELMRLIDANTRSNFVYIRYYYYQLGRSETWFKEICKDMLYSWPDIRREVLLQWSMGVQHSPFEPEQLEYVSRNVREPKKVVYFLGKYIFNIYEEIEYSGGVPRRPPIIGVDVSGGYNRDSSAICCIDSETTKVIGDLKCNYISTVDLAKVIYELVSKFMPNAIVNVERNGGYGASVLAKLVGSSIKNNLYYEIKDKVIEETNDGIHSLRKKRRTKVYGLDSTKKTRELLIQILRERMENHKDKFVSVNIYNELVGMEEKRNGRIEHSDNTHDDLVFAYLMAMYVWYEGKDLRERFGLMKSTIKTDEDVDDDIDSPFSEDLEDFIEVIKRGSPQADNKIDTEAIIHQVSSGQGKLYNQWLKEEEKRDEESLARLLTRPDARQAYSEKYNLPIEDVDFKYSRMKLPDEVFNMDNDSSEEEPLTKPHDGYNPNDKVPKGWYKL